MKTILSWPLCLFFPLGVGAQVNSTPPNSPPDFSNPSALFSQAVVTGQVSGSNANLYYSNFQPEEINGALAIDLAKGPVAVGAQVGLVNLSGTLASRSSIHLKYRHDWSEARIKGLQWLAEVSLPATSQPYFDFENHLFAMTGALSIGLQSMADVPIAPNWRINPFVRLDVHKSSPWASQRILIYNSEYGFAQMSVLDADVLQFKQWEARLGTFITTHFSPTHFVQCKAWYSHRTIQSTHDSTQAMWGTVDLNGLVGFQAMYHTGLWEELMGFMGLGATSQNIVSTGLGTFHYGWQGQIFAGLRWGW